MKTQIFKNRASVAVAALAASIALNTGANAIPLQFEAPPGPAYNSGGVKMKIADLDMGTVYPNLGPGSYGDLGNVALGIAALNGLTLPANQAIGSIGGEDSWGIASAAGIFANPGSATNPIWTSFVKGYELNAVFYGAQDFATTIAGTTQTTQSAGLHIDLYRNPIGTFDATKLLGGAGHTGSGAYGLISAGGPATLELSFLSVAGGISASPLSEFETSYSPGAGGTGSAYLNVIGGLSAAQWNTNSIPLLFGAPGQFADISINFTTRGPAAPGNAIPPGTNWLVSSEDPLLGAVIPEPTTVLAGLGCLLPMLLGRRRKQTLA